MPTGDRPLTHPERSPIFALKSTDRPQRPMAEQLGRDISTISRELSRHHGQRDYRHQQARASDEPAPGSLCRVLEDDPERWEAVEDRVKAGWSPEQTDGRAARCIVACATGEEAELSGRATRRLSTDGSLPGFRPRETGGGDPGMTTRHCTKGATKGSVCFGNSRTFAGYSHASGKGM